MEIKMKINLMKLIVKLIFKKLKFQIVIIINIQNNSIISTI